jgi:4-hydroxy-3-polyprenylbenzoate decarboxylase
MSSYIIAVTGASGAIYGMRLLEYLVKNGLTVYLTVTKEAWWILKDETGLFRAGTEDETEDEINSSLCEYYGVSKEILHYYGENNMKAPVASGSFRTDGMVIVPCSMKTVASIASGVSSNLVGRSADVILKEKRKLIIVPRETPLNTVHLRNLLTLSEMGIHIIPAMPAFYNKPATIDDMVEFIVGRILDALCIDNNLYARWGSR